MSSSQGGGLGDSTFLCQTIYQVSALSMSTKFGPAGIPGTRLKVCVWWGGCNTSPRLGAGALMLNAWTGLLQFLQGQTW